jgi:predicted RND superfamily exporter protein
MFPLVQSRRSALIVLVAALFLAPVTFNLVRRAVRSNANDLRDWLPAHYEQTQQYRWFREHFGSEDFIVVSWPGCTLYDERLDQMAARLRQRNELLAAKGQNAPFTRVSTGREVVAQLTGEPSSLKKATVISRLEGTLIGPDQRQSCAVVTLADQAHSALKGTIREIEAAAADIGIPADQLHLGGPPVVNAAIDRSSTQSLVQLAGLAAFIGLGIAWLCFRTVRMTLIVFAVGIYSATLSLAMVPLLGVSLNAILVTMAPLVYVAGMSGAIHLSNYYLDELRAGHGERAIVRAIRHAGLPLGLATATTAIGLLSLYFSDLAPIRLFGLFSAIGVAISLVLQLVLLPALLILWPARPQGRSAALGDGDALEPLSPAWERLAGFVIRRQAWLACAGVLLLAMGAVGLARIQTSIQVMRLFAPGTPIIASYAWLEEKLGALVPLEVVVRFDKDDESSLHQRLMLVSRVQEEIAGVDQVGGSLSAATFAPDLPRSSASLGGFMVNRRLEKARPRLEQSGYLVQSGGEELWRISVRVKAVDDLDYDAFQSKLQARVAPLLTDAGGHVSVVYTGAVPIIYKARRSLLDGLTLGFGTDILLVVVSVVVLLRHWSNGIVLLLTSVFPMLIVFGMLGWQGVVVDIGSVMTPCVALGVTIDDVIHFLLWYRRGIEQGKSQPDAVRLAYAGCGRAMVQSWGVIGLGLAAFALSNFTTTFRFGSLMIALLTAGLASNLFFLPALLAGPVGSWIAARVRRTAERQQSRAASPVQPAIPEFQPATYSVSEPA